jgi:phosphatidylserine decarboxylase
VIAKDGYVVILGAAGILAVLAILARVFLTQGGAGYVLWISTLLLFCIVLFFRDPDRQIDSDKPGSQLVVAPADGKVIEVVRDRGAHQESSGYTRISIFLSLFDVHVTRVPADGVIESAEYIPGRFKAAWDSSASSENERAEFTLIHPTGARIVFRQIAGLVARRVVHHLERGEAVRAGERFGLIRFGSRMDVLVPDSVRILASTGDRVRAGESVLGVFDAQSGENPPEFHTQTARRK